MNTVKGFVTINQFINNTPGQISPLGELSTHSRTYSREKGEYQDATVPGYKLTTFKSAQSNDNLITVPSALAREILEVINDCVIYATGHIRPYDSIDFKNSILTNFYLKVTNLHIGNFIDNGSLALPEWISWNSAENDNTLVRIWLADVAFQDQYDESYIIVVPPIDNIDNFYNAYNIALTEIKNRTNAQLSDKIQVLKAGNPESYLRLLDFGFVNLLDVDQVNLTTWGAIIYGKVGDNIDSIKDAIVEYVLSHSVHTKNEWEAILPELFRRTEFVILPRWDKVSIPNLTEAANLYSSMLSPTECIQFAKNAINFYDSAYVQDNISIFPFDYKALTLVSVDGITNQGTTSNLIDLFPDYIPVASTSPDFNRMLIKTRDWMMFLQELIIVAETATPFTSVPLTVRKQYKSNLLFISAMFDNVNYLVATKSNILYNT